MKIIFHLGTIVGAFLAITQLSVTFSYAENPMQQAAGFALAIALVLIPYCLAHAVEQISRT